MKNIQLIVRAWSCLALFTLPVVAEELPNIKPLQVATDTNSVDLLSGKYYPNLPVLSIPAAPRLLLQSMQQLDSKIEGTTSGSESGADRIESYSLTFGGKISESINCTTDGCIASDGTGSRLVGSMKAANVKFTYSQGKTGIKVIYDQKSFFVAENGRGTWYASQIIYPDGEKHTINYHTATVGSITYHRPKSVLTNIGYQLHLTYQSDNISTGASGWSAVKTARIVKSDAIGVPLASYSYNNSGNNSLTDILGRTWQYTGFSSAMGADDFTKAFSFILPGDSSTSLNVTSASKNYGGVTHNEFVTAVTRDGQSYNYAYSAVSGTGYDPRKQFSKITITGPENYQRTLTLKVLPAPQSRQLIEKDEDGLGGVTSYTYTGVNQVKSVTYPHGHQEIYTYDDLGNVIKKQTIAKSGSQLAEIVESAYYNISSCQDKSAGGNILCFRPEYTIDAKNNRTDYTFDAKHGGLLTKLEPADANGIRRLTKNIYESINGFDRLVESYVCDAANCSGKTKQITKYSYWNNTALPLAVTKTSGSGGVSEVTTYQYDDAGRQLMENGPLTGDKDATFARYDAAGRKTWAIGAENQQQKRQATFTSYRNRDDQVQSVVQGPLVGTPDMQNSFEYLQQTPSLTTNHEYNTLGLLIKTEMVAHKFGGTQIERVQQFGYDGRNRQQCVVTRMNPLEFYSPPSDACALGTAGNYGADRIVKHEYDIQSKLLKTSSGVGTADAGTDIAISYYPSGLVRSRKDGNNNTTSYTYDGFGRLWKTHLPDSRTEINTYDANGNLDTFTKRDGWTLTHRYDAVNRLQSTTVPTEDAIVFAYDAIGRETSVSRGAQVVTKVYEDLGRLESSSTTINGGAKKLSYQYDEAGRRKRLTYPDNVFITYKYEPDSSLKGIYKSDNSALVEYSYDAENRLSKISRGNGVVSELGFTPLNQLQKFDHIALNTASFAYSPAGQLINRIVSNIDFQIQIPQPGQQNYVPNNMNQYTQVAGKGLTYDFNGNLTNHDGWDYSYNLHNRLISARKDAVELLLDYDATGRLNSSTSDGYKTSYLYDGDELVMVFNGSGTMLNRYVHGIGSDDPLVSYQGAATTNPTYLLADERGSIIAETNKTGAVILKHQYGPYGEPINSSTARFRYTGQILLPGTELYHYKARVYHPKLGRFLQTDPLGYKDGMNWYAYVGNDPMNATDSKGTVGTRIPGRESVNSSEYGAGANASAAKSGKLSFGDISEKVNSNNNSGLGDSIIISIAYKESRFDPTAKNKKSSATGLMQMTKTAVKEVNRVTGSNFKHSEMTNADSNIAAATAYIKIRVDRAGGNVSEGLNGYGTGPGYSDNLLKASKLLDDGNINPMKVLEDNLGK